LAFLVVWVRNTRVHRGYTAGRTATSRDAFPARMTERR
jgi:hypothetical protein